MLSWKIRSPSWKNEQPSWNFWTPSWKNRAPSWKREYMESNNIVNRLRMCHEQESGKG